MSAVATMPAPTRFALAPQALVTLDALLRAELDAQRLLIDDAEATMRDLAGSTGGDSAHERDIAERSMNHALDVIAEIERALERVATATYGTCETCGDSLPIARLEAIPYARTCVRCPPPPPLSRLD
jgi:RNA polymerase-binding transcription factor DksA